MDKSDIIFCAYCGKDVSAEESWPHVDGDSNLGVRKIDCFCSESHKIAFLIS
jgi:hypothetical protein